jgi:DNA-binding transcriptional ArsR family regulator
MDLDFETIRALSSPTRIKILSGTMDSEATPTSLSREVGKSKSTVSSHLEKLVDSGLVEKEEEEGRKRVVYRPTKKAEAILKGKRREVRFSVASSAITGLAGIGLLTHSRRIVEMDSGPGLMMESSRATTQEVVYSEPFLLAGIFFMTVAVSSLLYGILLKKLPEYRRDS